jgi:hypothetical protein
MKRKKTGVKGKGLAHKRHEELSKIDEKHKDYRKPRRYVYTSKDKSQYVGRDLLGMFRVADDVVPGDLLATLPINPLELGLTGEEIQAQLSEQFKVHQLGIHKARTTGAVVNGAILGFWQRDPTAPAPEGEKGLQEGYFKGGTEAQYKNSHDWRLPHFAGLPTLYNQNNGSDDRFTEQAIFYIMVTVPPSVYTNTSDPGGVEIDVELWVTYHIEFDVRTIDLAPSLQQAACGLETPTEAYTPSYEMPNNINRFGEPLYDDQNSRAPNYIPGMFWTRGPDASSWVDGIGYNMCTIGMMKGFGLDRIKACDFMMQTVYSEAKNDGKAMTVQKLTAQQAYCINVVQPDTLTFENQTGPIDYSGGPEYAHTCFTRIDIDQPGYSEQHTVAGTVYYIDADGKKQTLASGASIDVLWCFSWRGGHTGGSSPYQWPDGAQTWFSTYAVLSVVNIDSSPPLENFLGPGTVQYRIASQLRAERRSGKEHKGKRPNRHEAFNIWCGRRRKKEKKDYLSKVEEPQATDDEPEEHKSEGKVQSRVKDIEDLISDSLTKRPRRLVTTPMSQDGVLVSRVAHGLGTEPPESKKRSLK